MGCSMTTETDIVLEEAERILRMRRQALNDIRAYELKLSKMSKKYKIDMSNDIVKYCKEV